MTKKTKSFNVWSLIKVILAFLLVGFVISKIRLADVLALQGKISVFWLVATLVLFVLMTVLKALQYYVLIGRKIAYPSMLNIVVVQNTVSNFIATGAGLASYLTMSGIEQRGRIGRAALVFILTKIGDLISIWVFMSLTAYLLWPRVAEFHEPIFAILAGITITLLLFFAAVLLRRRFADLAAFFASKMKLMRIGVIDKFIGLLYDLAEQELVFIFHMVGVGILFSALYMAVTMLWIYATLHTFSFPIDLLTVTFVNSFMQLVSYLPIQIFGGLGVNEMTSLYLYGIFNYPQAEIAAVLIASRLLFYLLNLIVLLYLPIQALFSHRSSDLSV